MNCLRGVRRVGLVCLVFVLAGCGAATPSGVATPTPSLTPSPTETAAAVATATPTPTAARTPKPFPSEAFAAIRSGPVSSETASTFQAALEAIAGDGGMTATVMTADGTWSGAAGKADGVRDMRVDDQFAIASATKPVIAAQVMQMVEAGELALDDPATDHLPPDLDFDTNEATIRQLLSHRSGLPDYEEALWNFNDGTLSTALSADRQRRWTAAELLKLVAPARWRAGTAYSYSGTNYLLLRLIIEQVRGRPVAEVLRDGVLSGDGLERLVYQPAEAPTEPMAMPDGASTAALKEGGGYLPSLAEASAGDAGSAMASDSPSFARWWRAFCAGEIVSQASLAEMSTLQDGYGLGLHSLYPGVVGHGGWHVGYMSWAGCLPEDGSVIIVLANHAVDDISGMAGPLVEAARSN